MTSPTPVSPSSSDAPVKAKGIPTDVYLRTVKSYVLRAGRTTIGQAKAYELYGPANLLDYQASALDMAMAFGRVAPVIFEIGFGMGTSLIEMAKAAPGKDFIGIEVHPPGIGNLLKLMDQEQLTNIRVYQADARAVLEKCIADASLGCLQIFFPDPWHKKRHYKRRMIQADFIDEIRPKLVTGGVLHLATDWQPYAVQMMQLLSADPGFRNAAGENKYTLEHDRPTTKFEQRGQKLGHGVWDLMFVKSVPGPV
jgi:tRNA (guanine-N7-)-methyltransferase